MTTIATGNRRLLKLATLLEEDARNTRGLRFDMGTWGIADTGRGRPGIDCGTSACAMGLAVLSGAFKRAGLVDGGHGRRVVPTLRENPSADGFMAAQVIFGLSEEESYDLFGNSGDVGAKAERAVARRIRQFVKRRSAKR